MRDRASTNNVAVQTLTPGHSCRCRVFLPYDRPCWRDCSTLAEFVTLWISLFSHNPKTKMLWRSRTGHSMASYSKTRWWSKWEIKKHLRLFFGDVELFLRENDDIGHIIRPKLLAFFYDPHTKSKLQIEMAATVDWGEPFVKACYVLEGGGPLVLRCYEVIDRVRQSIVTENVPNVRALSEKLTRQPRSHPHHEQWVDYARDCVRSGIDYFNCHSLKVPLEIFKTCCLFSPHQVGTMRPTAASLDQTLSTTVPFITQAEIEDLKKELPHYIARVADLSAEFDPVEWWKLHSTTLLHWSTCARKIFLIQPSSAAAETVFSLLKASFGRIAVCRTMCKLL